MGAMKGQKVDIIDGVKLDCAVDLEDKIYMASMLADGPSPIPLVETAGAVGGQGAWFLWSLMEKQFKRVWHMRPSARCPKAPFICDIVYPSAIARMDVLEWSGSFTSFFGIEMLKMMSASMISN